MRIYTWMLDVNFIKLNYHFCKKNPFSIFCISILYGNDPNSFITNYYNHLKMLLKQGSEWLCLAKDLTLSCLDLVMTLKFLFEMASKISMINQLTHNFAYKSPNIDFVLAIIFICFLSHVDITISVLYLLSLSLSNKTHGFELYRLLAIN